MKLNLRAFALATGIWWGAWLFLLVWWLIATGASGADVGMLGQLYPGYAISPIGSLVGLVWGFACGLISGAVLAWLYNALAGRLGTEASGLASRPA